MNALRPAVSHAAMRQALPRLRLRLLLTPVLLRILWLHYTCAQGAQFARLGRRSHQSSEPLPESWAFWAAHRIGRFVFRIPMLQRRACYWRSQMVFDILPRFGFPVRMHLGAAREDREPGQGVVHMWVSLRGAVLGSADDGPGKYLELATYQSEVAHD
jgi:hypothetical protein